MIFFCINYNCQDIFKRCWVLLKRPTPKIKMYIRFTCLFLQNYRLNTFKKNCSLPSSPNLSVTHILILSLPCENKNNIHGFKMWYSRFTQCRQIYLI